MRMEISNCGDKDNRSPGIVEEDDDEIFLKKRISGHPLFGLLIETHLKCLKVAGLSECGEVAGHVTTELARHRAADSKSKKHDIIHNPSGLDHFMEAYCKALSSLKEGLEEAQQESESFIQATYRQLGEITRNNCL